VEESCRITGLIGGFMAFLYCGDFFDWVRGGWMVDEGGDILGGWTPLWEKGCCDGCKTIARAAKDTCPDGVGI